MNRQQQEVRDRVRRLCEAAKADQNTTYRMYEVAHEQMALGMGADKAVDVVRGWLMQILGDDNVPVEGSYGDGSEAVGGIAGAPGEPQQIAGLGDQGGGKPRE